MQTRNRQPRRGYTIIELMAVVTIVGILATLTIGASVKYMATARRAATETTLQILDTALTQRWESFWAKTKPGALPYHNALAGQGPLAEARLLQLRRGSLIAKLDAMRGDFPQQFADFLPISAPGGLSRGVSSKARTAIERLYRQLTYAKNPAAVPNNNNPAQQTQIAPHDAIAESSACLYLMLSVSSGEGNSFDMSQIKPEFIKDTDGDGIPEFVDSWGTPLRFYRWPTDYLTYLHSGLEPTVDGPQVMAPPPPVGTAPPYVPADFPGNALDPGELLKINQVRIDARSMSNNNGWSDNFGDRFAINESYFRVRDVNGTPFAYPTYPLIVSAGPDATQYTRDFRWQAFGLTFDQSERTGNYTVPIGPINYSWPQASSFTGGTAGQDYLAARMGKPVTTAFAGGNAVPGAGAFTDNIVSRRIRAGQEHQ